MTSPSNVKEAPWRAVGNGVADDYHAIQSAIDAVAAAGGGTVFLPGGDYLISKMLAWTAPNVYLEGDGAARILPSLNFFGASAVMIGAPSSILKPTYRGGIENVTVDLGHNQTPDLTGVELCGTWFTRVSLLRIVSPNGMARPSQTAFRVDAGSLPGNAVGTNWAANNSVRDLQISGSFLYSVRHTATAGGLVNGTNYFGGFGYCTAKNKAGSFGFRVDDGAGDTTRVYGMALEDYDVGVYVGFQNNGPLDFRIEDCTTPYAAAPGVTFSIPALQSRP